jgi:NAD(P)-dependent dehydrogenase (short-subunit alcohol dehydrogenase family)
MSDVVLITGANKGIGFEVARQLARAGSTVVLGARDAGRGEAAAGRLREEGLDVRFAWVDLERAVESGAAVAKRIEAEFGHLDVLINNAGIVDPDDGLPGKVSNEALRRIFETNFFGAVLFTQPLLPLLRAARQARIVNVSSGLGSLATNGDAGGPFYHVKPFAYNASKAAVNMFTVDLAYELRETNIKVNSATPGYVATDLNGHSGPMTVEEGAVEIVRLARLPEDGPTGGFFYEGKPYPW